MTTIPQWGTLSLIELLWLVIGGVAVGTTLPALALAVWAWREVGHRERADGRARPRQRRVAIGTLWTRVALLVLQGTLLGAAAWATTVPPTTPNLSIQQVSLQLALAFGELLTAGAAVRNLIDDVALLGGWRALARRLGGRAPTETR